MKHISKRSVAAWVGAWLATLVIMVAITNRACSAQREPAPSVTQLTEPTDVIDEELMLALLQAKNFHRKAKVYMSDGNLVAATAAVRQILSLQFPQGAPEAEDVRLDARALLAKLLVAQGQLEEAMRTVSEGLAETWRESFFVANLHTVQGEIHEARAAILDAEGPASKPKADDERRAAISALDRSIQINEKLQKRMELRHKQMEQR